MKPVASILALAIALASNIAFASPETEGAHDNIKVESTAAEHGARSAHGASKKSDETASKKEPSKDGKKPQKQQARAVAKGRAHGHDKSPALVQASMRTPASTKESKPAKTKKADKKGDQKHPTQASVDADPGARDHGAQMPDSGHAEPPASRSLAMTTEKKKASSLPELPSPSASLKNASAHEAIAKEPETSPATEAKKHHGKKGAKTAAAKALCLSASADFLRGPEADSFPLTQCDGAVASHAQEKLSIVLRPASISRPTADSMKSMHKTNEVASGIMKVDTGLALRLEQVLEHFKTDGHAPKVAIVSGFRPNSTGSLHALGRAIDFRLEGVDNVKLAEFCKSLPDTGCGYYPNSSFVHMDVRDAGSGHTAWIDASGPGEAPRYVSQWPLPADSTENKPAAPPEKAAADDAETSESTAPAEPH